MVHIDRSPLENNSLKPFLECKDYTVSHKNFTILKDERSELLVTSPRPELKDLNKYYESDQYISHTDAKKSSMDKVYQLVKNFTIKQKVVLINSYKSDKKTILDIGCGTGDFLAACKKNNWNVSGVEPNENAREIAKQKIFKDCVNTSTISLEEDLIKYLNEKKKFDVITLWHVLEHVPNLEEYISNLKNLLKPNGTIIIAVPNYKSYDASYYGKFWAAYDVPRHLWHFSKRSIQLLFEKEIMEVVKMIPMKFDSYYVSLLSEKYKTNKTNFMKAVWVGFQSNMKAKSTFEYSSLIYVIKNSK
ncbi:MAG: class I SAM-dependent methyltransferase [Bacteroidota bacterium]